MVVQCPCGSSDWRYSYQSPINPDEDKFQCETCGSNFNRQNGTVQKEGSTMANIDYGGVKRALANRQEYKHGSSYAERTNDEYRVYSYNTLILVYSLLQQNVVSFDDSHYSNTTSRLQNMLRVAFNISR